MNHYSYQLYEMAHLALAPARAVSDAALHFFKNSMNPMAHTAVGKNIAAAAELFERMTRRYGKPVFGIDSTFVDGVEVEIEEQVIWEKPFCKLLHFRHEPTKIKRVLPKMLIVAPMSGHYATLLRGTVETFIKTHDVYITDWADARMVPLSAGQFDLDDYVDYLIDMCHALSKDVDGVPLHTLGVCQPSVPLLAAVAVMEKRGDRNVPASMTLMGGPIDTRRSPTAVNKLAEERGPEWFRRNCIHTVPFP